MYAIRNDFASCIFYLIFTLLLICSFVRTRRCVDIYTHIYYLLLMVRYWKTVILNATVVIMSMCQIWFQFSSVVCSTNWIIIMEYQLRYDHWFCRHRRFDSVDAKSNLIYDLVKSLSVSIVVSRARSQTYDTYIQHTVHNTHRERERETCHIWPLSIDSVRVKERGNFCRCKKLNQPYIAAIILFFFLLSLVHLLLSSVFGSFDGNTTPILFCIFFSNFFICCWRMVTSKRVTVS